MLARRELSEAQIRVRLDRRGFEPAEIDAAVARLRHERALDDRRTALACARTEAHVKRHGRLRVLRQLDALGIDRGIARAAVSEVFADIDEDSLLAQALEKRLRGDAAPSRASVQRIRRYLLARGFPAAQVSAVIRGRIRNVQHED
jgi:regulatory protein